MLAESESISNGKERKGNSYYRIYSSIFNIDLYLKTTVEVCDYLHKEFGVMISVSKLKNLVRKSGKWTLRFMRIYKCPELTITRMNK